MRVLIIGPDERKAIQDLVEFASKPENLVVPGVTRFVPGDRPEFVIVIPHEYRCVFSNMKSNSGEIYRHLSISVPHLMPSPESCVMIAKEFGFTVSDDNDLNIRKRGRYDGWQLSLDKEVVILAQSMGGLKGSN